MMTKALLAAAGLGLALLAGGCDGRAATSGGADDRLTVAVSIDPQAWLVERVGGERVHALVLVGPGESPHTFSPSDAQITAITRAKAYFRMGATFEATRWFQNLERDGSVRGFDLREGIELLAMEEDGHHHDHGHDHHDHGGRDPHIWLSPRLLKVQAATVAAALAEIDPDHAAVYQARLAEVQQELDALDAELTARLAPFRGRAFFVFHPAWGYFAHDYGLEQVAIEVAGKAPTDRELTQLQTRARAAGVNTIFVQPQFGGDIARVIAERIGAGVQQLDPQARDVPANLRQVTEALIASWGGRAEGRGPTAEFLCLAPGPWPLALDPLRSIP